MGRADRLPHRRVRRVGDRLRGRVRRHERHGRRSRRRPRGQWDADDPWAGGERPGFAPSFRVWGYETNWGSFAQFTKVQAHQCLPKAAAPDVGGGRRADARRRDRLPHAARLAAAHRPSRATSCSSGAASGGLGSLADPDRRARRWARRRGRLHRRRRASSAEARRGRLRQPQGLRPLGHAARTGTHRTGRRGSTGAKAFGKAIWDALGEKTPARGSCSSTRAGHDPDVDLRVRQRRHGRDLRRAPGSRTRTGRSSSGRRTRWRTTSSESSSS